MADDSDDANFSPEEITQAAQAGTLEALANRAVLELEGDAWMAFVASVVDLHRKGEIDLLASAAQGEGPVGYMLERLYSDAFPELEATVPAMLDLAAALATRSRDGSLPYFMYDTFSKWAERDPDRIEDALAAIRAGSAVQSLLVATLQAGVRSARGRYLPIVVSLLKDGTDEEAAAAGFVLGTLEAVGAEERQLVEDALAQGWTSSDAARRLATFSAALSIGTRDVGEESVALAAIDAIGINNSPQIRQAAAKALFLARKAPSETLVSRMCDLLRETEAGETETIEAINHAIAQNLSGPTAAPRLSLLSDLLKRGVATLETMDDTAHYILANKGALLTTLVTEWLADGSDHLIGAVHDLLMQAVSARLIFDLDFSTHALTLEQTLIAARKIVPSLILFPNTVASILLSLMRTGHADAAPELEALLFDPLLISYWEGPRQFLADAAPNQPLAVQERIARVIAKLDEYVAAIHGAGIIRELGPSERQRFLYHVLRLEEQRTIEKSVRKKSVFADLFPTRVLLYGDSVVSEVHRGDGKTERQEFQLTTVEHSQEIARLDAIDPIGFWYERIVLSMGKQP